MKKLSIIISLGCISALFFSRSAVAQENPFVVLEYMHVSQENSEEYLQVENL